MVSASVRIKILLLMRVFCSYISLCIFNVTGFYVRVESDFRLKIMLAIGCGREMPLSGLV